ncbi:transcriptional regulator, LacI family [Faunimonas pinastri]|uniref:Transcriptional regulator, LacI family n=1 Tax=Faunimonas pinastri TaxID=1855383 RepID=A0A1H9IN71_9HYPH|nr:LacI family DNA-binding transcriptional regulator [Faunimonas pinastri]SEQ75942.1 transcriptional regulator, LacI family [Faunimonas pinastri]
MARNSDEAPSATVPDPDEVGARPGARPERRGTTTLAMVASRVGVSLNTVSRALRAPHTVRPELKRRIDQALQDLNYVPNRLAGGLAGTRSDIVGVVITSLFHSEFAAVVDTLQAQLLDRNLQVMLGNSRYDPEEERRLVRSILSWRPAAVAIVGCDHHPEATELLASCGAPIVEMWDVGGDIIDSAVGMDHEAIGRAQAEHLLSRGYRRLAFLGSLREADARARKRASGMAATLAEAGLPPLVRMTRPEGGHPDLGESLLHELLAAHRDVDGIVCNSDAVAFGVLRGLRRVGQNVPGDRGVVGFGDVDAGSCISPTLTSVRPARHAIGRLTAETILARIAGEEPRRITVDWELLERESTAR